MVEVSLKLSRSRYNDERGKPRNELSKKKKETHREQQTNNFSAERNKKMQLKKNKIKLNFDCINL